MDDTTQTTQTTQTEQTQTEQTQTETVKLPSGQQLTADAETLAEIKKELHDLREENKSLREANTKLLLHGTAKATPTKSVEENIYDVFKNR